MSDGDSVSITDLGSTNGTIVDGLELAPNVETMLAVGGEVTFGKSSLTSPGEIVKRARTSWVS